jgi:hypothetical protein
VLVSSGFRRSTVLASVCVCFYVQCLCVQSLELLIHISEPLITRMPRAVRCGSREAFFVCCVLMHVRGSFGFVSFFVFVSHCAVSGGLDL